VLQARLLAFVNARIQNGEFSERALARRMGISQSQLHNVLKGARRLQTSLADAFLIHFEISLLDLLNSEELQSSKSRSSKNISSSDLIELRLLRKYPSISLTRESPKREAS
jgi:transcriptional regulator with XRE-family HTH domain